MMRPAPIRRAERSAAVGLFAALLLLLGACSSTYSREVYIESRPTGARVEIEGVDVGITPLRTTLDFPGASETVAIQVEKEGYRRQIRHVTYQGPSAIVFPLRRVKKPSDED